jgi:phosphoglycolate phosphatase-like HAD superfamily hydrolase
MAPCGDKMIPNRLEAGIAPNDHVLSAMRIVFWDFDGVIKDSVAVKTVGFEQLFLPYGQEVADRVRQHHEAHGGVSRYKKMPVYLEWAGETATAANIQHFCDRFSSLVQQAVIDAPWVPGVREYLLARHASQYFVLVTATPQQEIEQILGALEIAHCFREVYGAPTSKAEAIGRVLQHLKCPPVDALMIGDSETDLEAADANGVSFLLRRTALNRSLQARYSGPTFDGLKHE